jgi:hypothetical protein
MNVSSSQGGRRFGKGESSEGRDKMGLLQQAHTRRLSSSQCDFGRRPMTKIIVATCSANCHSTLPWDMLLRGRQLESSDVTREARKAGLLDPGDKR